jgi:hypothetical protein
MKKASPIARRGFSISNQLTGYSAIVFVFFLAATDQDEALGLIGALDGLCL